MNVISDPQASLPEAEQSFAIDLRHGLSFGARNRMATTDIVNGLALWRLALTLSWLDIRLRYRGSVLGPLWLTLSTAVMVGALGFLYAELFHTSIRDYLPFLALSLVLWSFIASMVSDACTCFTQSENMIRSMRIPFSLYIMQIVARNVLILAHNVIVIVVVFLVFEVHMGLVALAALPGLMLWMIDCAAASLLLGAICARFRDIPPIVGSIMQIAFYVSAVMWKPSFLGGHQGFLAYDPFFTILQVVRGPLLNQIPTFHIYISAVGSSVVLCLCAWMVFLRVRHRIAFWI
jgi:lipopolysaccharide transport system permease protein